MGWLCELTVQTLKTAVTSLDYLYPYFNSLFQEVWENKTTFVHYTEIFLPIQNELWIKTAFIHKPLDIWIIWFLLLIESMQIESTIRRLWLNSNNNISFTWDLGGDLGGSIDVYIVFIYISISQFSNKHKYFSETTISDVLNTSF